MPDDRHNETSSSELDEEHTPLRGVTAELLASYDCPGPRYTSYPTAVEFSQDVDAAVYHELLVAADESATDPLSVYMHLPFCQEQCLFCACHVVISPHYERSLPYLEDLRREIDRVAERLPRRREVSQLHLGGGTPTYYRPEHLSGLLEHFFSRFRVRDNAELAVEVDPRVTTEEHIDMLAEHGFNRLSMGVQDFAKEVQESIHRIQGRDCTERLLQHARSRGFRGLNVDLVYGLPHQSPSSFELTVRAVIEMGVDRVAVYSFAYVPWLKGHQRRLATDSLPDRDVKFGLFAMARECLLDAGYEPIGMDHFARPDDELARARRRHELRRNFQGYTVLPAPDVLGLGVSAIGDVGNAYVQNAKKLSEYQSALEAGSLAVTRGVVRDSDDEVRRYVIHELMCNFHVDLGAVERRFEIDFGEYFREDLVRLQAHADEGMVQIDEDAIQATPLGEVFVRNLAMCFDRYWRDKHEQQDTPVFSRTV